MTPRFDWQITRNGQGKRVTSIGIRRRRGARGQTDTVTVDLWSEVGAPVHRRQQRAIVGDAPTTCALPGRSAGRCLFALKVAGRTVAGGRFPSPDKCAANGHHPEVVYQGTYLEPHASCRQR
jgi:hypothetical protein